MTRWLNRVALASGVVRLLEENLTADHSRPTGVEGATLHARIKKIPSVDFVRVCPYATLGPLQMATFFRLYPALPFSRPLQSKNVFSVSHPNLAFLYQFDFFQLVLVPIMHVILATER